MAEWTDDPAQWQGSEEGTPPGFLNYIALAAIVGFAVNITLIWAGFTGVGFWIATLPGAVAWMLFKVGKGVVRRRVYGEPGISGKALKSPAAWIALLVLCWLVASLWYRLGAVAGWAAASLR